LTSATARRLCPNVVVDPNFDWKGEPRGRAVPWEQTILYETHLRGFTKLHPEVPEAHRGTYKGLGNKAVVNYIKSARRDFGRAVADTRFHQ
jgi:isoamylase